MKTLRPLYFFLLLLFFPAVIHAQSEYGGGQAPQFRPYYYFSQFQTSNGLPNNSVSCFSQDNDGFLWIGTRDGICRFDGSTFIRMGDVQERWQMNGVVEAVFLDDEGLLWFSTALGRGFYDPRAGTLSIIDIELDEEVSVITQDGNGSLWFCSNDLYRYDKKTGAISTYPSKGFRFVSAATSSSGRFWCTCSDGRMMSYDSLTDKFKEEPFTGFQHIVPVSGDHFLASTSDGEVKLIDPHRRTSTTIFDCTDDAEGRYVTSLIERVPGEYWVGTRGGIYIYSEGEDAISHISHSDSERMSISSSIVSSLFADREGNVWVGTYYSGLNLWRDTRSAYYLLYPTDDPGSMKGKIVRALTLHNNEIWVGTEDGGLNSLTLGASRFIHHELPGGPYNYQDILSVGDELWISTYGNGLIRYNPRTSTLVRKYRFGDDRNFRGFLTSSGDILVGTSSGLYRYVPTSDSFERVAVAGRSSVTAFCEDFAGRIWVGTLGQGVLLLDRDLRQIGSVGRRMRVTSFFEDSSHRMWVTTEGGGVNIVDTASLELTRLTHRDGLPSNTTCSVTEDDDGMIWLSTIYGLYILDPADFRIVTSFSHKTQIESNLYTFGTVCKYFDSVFMGTSGGMLSFTPSLMKSFHQDKTVYITSITGIVGSRLTELRAPGGSQAGPDRIVASYKDVSSLSIGFSCPNFSNILSSSYEYTFSSRRGTISSVTDGPYAVLSNIGYGRHTFTVSLVGSNAPESTKSVEIVVRPPFMKSMAADVLSALFFLSMLTWIGFSIRRQRKEKRRLQIEELERAKQKEMYESKNAFFMNITHEVRTPLALIKMPLDRIIKSGKYSEKDLLAIQANTDRLLDLTNQLLDIRKLEQNEEKLEFTRQDICDIVRRTCASFSVIAEEHGVALTVSVPDGGMEGMCARESIVKILSNLITNALKYGGDAVTVSLTAADGLAVMRVDSNGTRIPAEESERIFEKFVHGGKGTGLGLPLARALAELHEGRLYLDTSRLDVNSFVLELPLEHPESVVLPASEGTADSEPESYDDSRRDILIVEDNQDFRLYLSEVLSSDFNVFTAANGRAALEKLAEHKIDLIVSDIMMPVMDGCELCNTVKSTVEYSHIPVILLTAAVGMETRIETLEVGADGYIEKPFPIELLQANIANLFKNRDIAYHRFSNSPLSHINGVSTNRMDEELMSRLHSLILDRMAENTLSLDELSSALNISNSTLFRKVKANTGMNVNEYIRLCRLKRAAELLASRQYRVNEVADMVGFSSSSYFAANFQKQFNISPSAFLRSLDAKK